MKQIVLHLLVGDLQNKGVTVIPAKARHGRSLIRQTPQGLCRVVTWVFPVVTRV